MIRSQSANFQCTPNNNLNKTVFKEQSINLLHKIENLHIEIENNKMNKFKNFLSDISNMENNVERSTIQKKQLYQNLMKQISQLSKQTEQEQHTNVKLQLHIQNKLESFIKNNDKAFEKLKTERIATQERLNSFLQSKIEVLIKKCQTYKAPIVPLQQYKQQLETIKKQVNTFFKQTEKQQQKVQNDVFKIIEQCSNLLKDNNNQKIEIDALEYMKTIKYQIINKINKLNQQRNKIQQQVLNVLEKVYQVTASQATSTLI